MDSSTLLVVILAVAVAIPALLAWLWQRGRTGPRTGENVAPQAVASAATPLAVSEPRSLGKIEVTAIHHGTVGEEGEWVMVVSEDYEPVQLAGWKLTDEGARHTYIFPAATIEPGGRLRIHMWDGVDSDRDLYVGRRQNWWNNEGDTAYLYDAQGTLVHSHHYGSSPAKA